MTEERRVALVAGDGSDLTTNNLEGVIAAYNIMEGHLLVSWQWTRRRSIVWWRGLI
jgi:hypothetical protein